MKKDIHPKYNENAKISCSCGAVLTTGATQNEMSVEICSQCHPFYTGKKKVLDSTGRVDRFKKLAEKSALKKEAAKKAKIEKKAKKLKEEKKSKKSEEKKTTTRTNYKLSTERKEQADKPQKNVECA